MHKKENNIVTVAADMQGLLLLATYCYCCVGLFVAVDMHSLLLLAA